jgi:hypothetical protein
MVKQQEKGFWPIDLLRRGYNFWVQGSNFVLASKHRIYGYQKTQNLTVMSKI